MPPTSPSVIDLRSPSSSPLSMSDAPPASPPLSPALRRRPSLLTTPRPATRTHIIPSGAVPRTGLSQIISDRRAALDAVAGPSSTPTGDDVGDGGSEAIGRLRDRGLGAGSMRRVRLGGAEEITGEQGTGLARRVRLGGAEDIRPGGGMRAQARTFVPSDARRRSGGMERPINLAGSSSEDEGNGEDEDEGEDVVFTGERRGMDERQRAEMDRAVIEINGIIDRRGEDVAALLAADREDPRRRLLLSPPPAVAPSPPRPRIRLGGAVMRRGNQQINFAPPHQPPQAAPNPNPNPQQRMPIVNHPRRNERRLVFPEAEDIVPEGDGLDIGEGRYAGFMRDFLGRINHGQWGHLQRIYNEMPAMRRVHGMNDEDERIFARLGDLGGVGGVGGVGGQNDIETIINKVQLPPYPPVPEGFTRNFELADQEPIVLDEEGSVVISKKRKREIKPYIRCANCDEPLRISSAYRSADDRVWALRCGHLLDYRCLAKLSTPVSAEERAKVRNLPPLGLEVLGGEDDAGRRGRAGRAKRGGGGGGRGKKAVKEVPPEYAFECPVKGCRGTCGVIRESREESGGMLGATLEWKQKEGAGAIQVYA